jgi:hypothetical protein
MGIYYNILCIDTHINLQFFIALLLCVKYIIMYFDQYSESNTRRNFFFVLQTNVQRNIQLHRGTFMRV